jgi:hypothetical protein
MWASITESPRSALVGQCGDRASGAERIPTRTLSRATYSGLILRSWAGLDPPLIRALTASWPAGYPTRNSWSAATKRLLNTNEPGETALALVAMHLCLKYTCMLIDGRARVPADVQARSTCPIEPRRLRRWRDRLQGFRDEILHISDESEEGRGLNWHWTAAPPHFAFESSVGRRKFRHDRISRPEIEELLKQLDPWLHDHWERLVHEEDVDQDALGAKVDTTMRALGTVTGDSEIQPGG